MPQLSIIVPVYKVEKYLHKCIDSILSQTFTDFELILVDDGSPDRCPQICDEYAHKDSRVKVLHKKNGGQGSARNKALEVARGDYFGFVDSDDWIEKNMFHEMLNCAIANDASMVVCGIFSVTKIRTVPSGFPEKKEVWNTVEALKNYITTPYVGGTLWNKIYHKSLFESIRFPEIRAREDVYIMHQIISKASKIVHMGMPMYYRLIRPDSTEGKDYSPDKLVIIEIAMNLQKMIEEKFIELNWCVVDYVVRHRIAIIEDILITGGYYKYIDTITAQISAIRQEKDRIISSPYPKKDIKDKVIQVCDNFNFFMLKMKLAYMVRKLKIIIYKFVPVAKKYSDLNNMKIKILFANIAMTSGGIESYIITILDNFDYSKYDVTLFTESSGDEFYDKVNVNVNKISFFKNKLNSLSRNQRRLFSAILFLSPYLLNRFFLKVKFDCVVVNHAVLLGFYKLCRHNTIYIGHQEFSGDDDDVRYIKVKSIDAPTARARYYFKRLTACLENKINKFVMVSNTAKKNFCNKYTVKNEPYVIYNPIDIKKIREKGFETQNQFIINKFIFCTVARLTKQKRLDLLVLAANELRNRGIDFQIWIIGDGELKNELKIMADQYDLNSFVKFLGFQDNPYKYMKISNCYVSSSSHESFGISLVEAMTLGLPVISTECAGPTEILENNKYGLLCKFDYISLANAMEEMYKNDTLYRYYCKQSIVRAESFSVDIFMKKFEEVIKL